MIRLACVVLLCAIAHPVAAQGKPPIRKIGVQWADGSPRLSFSAKDLANEDVRKELGSGLRKRIVVTAQAYVDGSKALIASRKFSCAVTYDLWESAYVVKVGNRYELAADLDKVLARCLVVKGLIVGTGQDFERHQKGNSFLPSAPSSIRLRKVNVVLWSEQEVATIQLDLLWSTLSVVESAQPNGRLSFAPSWFRCRRDPF